MSLNVLIVRAEVIGLVPRLHDRIEVERVKRVRRPPRAADRKVEAAPAAVTAARQKARREK
jgi:hypothetical protein